MRKNLPVTQRERTFPAERRLISTTDLKGQITYCNEAFIEVCGFSREELMRAPHNLVRHPDVPPAVFDHMWRTLKAGRPWMGIVKNRCKNGDHYWVNAYVVPILENGKTVGYESVRSKPSPEQVRRAEALYRRVNGGKPAVPRRARWLPVLLNWLPFILVSQIGFAIGAWLDSAWGFALAALLCIPLGLAGLYWQTRGPRRLLSLARSQGIADPLIARMYTDGMGISTQLEMAMISQHLHLQTCLTRLQDTAEQLTRQASQADQLAQNSSNGLRNQMQETERVADSIRLLSGATQEVARHIGQTAEATRNAKALADQGRLIAEQASRAIEQLSRSAAHSSGTVARLAQDSSEIGGVVDVIKGITDQTNLLALNAAIEAARAGEMGRGFAVVADEVRLLAQRTADSTEQIHQLIAALQHTAEEAVAAMEDSRRQADESVAQVQNADRALIGIGEAVHEIADMAAQIATAADQQSSTAEEINRNIDTIALLAERTAGEAANSAQLSHELTATARGQHALVERFNR
ncbi:MAG TPA: PAS domain-containing methyl-accepting chemotaxis protein [Pseudomonas sp.]|nr:PAS domain-containing methyl-accepting chemotaxis protein [Pseudomonas sp.]